jgi:hypothetical protein
MIGDTSYFVVRTSYFLLLTIPPYPFQLQQQPLCLLQVELMGVVGVVLFDGGERRCAFGEVFAVVEIAGIGGDAVVVANSLSTPKNKKNATNSRIISRSLTQIINVIFTTPSRLP